MQLYRSFVLPSTRILFELLSQLNLSRELSEGNWSVPRNVVTRKITVFKVRRTPWRPTAEKLFNRIGITGPVISRDDAERGRPFLSVAFIKFIYTRRKRDPSRVATRSNKCKRINENRADRDSSRSSCEQPGKFAFYLSVAIFRN